MGLTPLEGLVMGTRSGDIDPAIIFHLHDTLGTVSYTHLDVYKRQVLTGDLPTPVKYFNSQIAQEYKAIEKIAQQKLVDMVPDEPVSYTHLDVYKRQTMRRDTGLPRRR